MVNENIIGRGLMSESLIVVRNFKKSFNSIDTMLNFPISMQDFILPHILNNIKQYLIIPIPFPFPLSALDLAKDYFYIKIYSLSVSNPQNLI